MNPYEFGASVAVFIKRAQQKSGEEQRWWRSEANPQGVPAPQRAPARPQMPQQQQQQQQQPQPQQAPQQGPGPQPQMPQQGQQQGQMPQQPQVPAGPLWVRGAGGRWSYNGPYNSKPFDPVHAAQLYNQPADKLTEASSRLLYRKMMEQYRTRTAPEDISSALNGYYADPDNPNAPVHPPRYDLSHVQRALALQQQQQPAGGTQQGLAGGTPPVQRPPLAR